MASKQPAVQGIFMKSHRISAFFAVLLVLWLGAAPAWGVSKEMVQLQTQVQQLQEQMTAMQRSFDERMGVMKNLVEQDTDAINKVAAALNGLQQTLAKQQGDSGGKVDQLSGQIQALNDTMDELKARLAKVSKQLEDMQSAQQSLGAPITAPAALPAGPACVRDMVKALGGEAPWLVSCRCSLAGCFAVHRGHRRCSDDPRSV